MRILIIYLLISLAGLACFSQENAKVNLDFEVVFRNSPVVLQDSVYRTHSGYEIKLSQLKFYISNVQFLKDETVLFAEPNSFHLLDLAVITSKNLVIDLPKKLNYNKIRFDLGIDSITNVSGAIGGDLDPTNGMYWTWQSGYINLKMEGTFSSKTGANKEFEFHLGGYQFPFNPIQTVEFETSRNNMVFALDLSGFFESIDFESQAKIMSPSASSVLFSKRLANLFSLK